MGILGIFDFTNFWAWGTLVGVGTALGLTIAYFASREYIRQTMEVLKDTIKTQEENLKAKDELAQSLSQTNKTLLDAGETRLTTMTAERDAYRHDLHETRKQFNAANLKVQELELRPDLNQVLLKEENWHQRREEFYTTMAHNQEAIIQIQRECLQLLLQVGKDVKTDLEQSHKVCTEVSSGLKDVAAKLNEREERQASRENEMMVTLTAILNELKNRPMVAAATDNGVQHSPQN